jgi:hypothetical protein
VQNTIETETAAIVRLAEDAQRLIRHLQELWLFGSVDTVGKTEEELKSEESVKEIVGLLEELLKKEGNGALKDSK